MVSTVLTRKNYRVLIIDTLLVNKHKAGDRLLARFRRRKLINRNFSVICNDCLAGMAIYQKLGVEYTTPTVGLFFYSDDYIKFLENFEHYIRQPLKFKKTSKHPEVNDLLKTHRYPIGVLGDDVEIQFSHYKDEIEAAEKWERRSKRINFSNLFFMYSDRFGFRAEFLDRYEKLAIKRKIFFSSKPRGHPGLVVFVRDWEGKSQVEGMAVNRKFEKYFDVVKWLNGEDDFLKQNE